MYGHWAKTLYKFCIWLKTTHIPWFINDNHRENYVTYCTILFENKKLPIKRKIIIDPFHFFMCKKYLIENSREVDKEGKWWSHSLVYFEHMLSLPSEPVVSATTLLVPQNNILKANHSVCHLRAAAFELLVLFPTPNKTYHHIMPSCGGIVMIYSFPCPAKALSFGYG